MLIFFRKRNLKKRCNLIRIYMIESPFAVNFLCKIGVNKKTTPSITIPHLLRKSKQKYLKIGTAKKISTSCAKFKIYFTKEVSIFCFFFDGRLKLLLQKLV